MKLKYTRLISIYIVGLLFNIANINAKENLDTTIVNFVEVEPNMASVLLAVDSFDKSRLSLEVFESKIEQNSNHFSSNFSYDYLNSGIMRGVNLAEIRFEITRTNPITEESFRVDSIRINYRFEDQIPENKSYFNPFFGEVVNQEHLEYLSNRTKSTKLSKVQVFENDWINEDLEYFKFYTVNDGIARVNHSDLISNNSQLIGKPSENILIYNRGKRVKFYSTSQVIQHNEFIYFVGSHAKGDTSYYNFYTEKEPYFITYDEDKKAEMFNLIGNEISGSKLERVEINNHYEVDNIYGNGVEVIETEQSLCENWYQAELRPPNDFGDYEVYASNFVLFPASSLDITYNYASNIFYLPETIKNKTKFSVNSHTEDTLSTSGSQVVENVINVGFEDLIQGGNSYSLESFKVVEDNRTDAYNGVIGFDFIGVKGEVKPIANKDYLSFLYDGNSESYTEIEGLTSDFVVVIDTVNNSIQFPETNTSSRIIVDTKDNFISFYKNKQIITDNRFGYYIVESLDNLDRVFYYDNSTSFLNKLSSINNENIAVLINLKEEISGNTKSTLSNVFNSNKINQSTTKYFALKLSDDIIEYNQNFEYLETFGNSAYKANVILKEGNPSRKIVNSLSSIQEVEVSDSKINKINQGEYDAFYIYHNSLEESLQDYISYISEKENKSILSIDVEQLYDTYGFGIESPHSIKNFLQASYNDWDVFPEFLVLVGDATWDPKKLMEKSIVDQMVPAYGIPYSDNFYGVLDGQDQVPEMVIGRIPVNNNDELYSYLDKIKTYYNVPQSPWMKKVLQISGGDESQKESFAFTMHELNDLFNSSELCFDTTTIGKTINTSVSEDKANEIKQSINEGKIWVNFLGHGSPHVIDMSGWEAPNLNNQGKYGILNTLSCNTSAFAEPHTINSIGEEYVNIKDKGFVATIGGTSTTFVNTALSVSTSIYNTLLNSNRIERNLGRIYNSYKPRASKSESTLHQVVLLGDPLLTVRIPDNPDIVIFKNDANLVNTNGSSVITELDKEVHLDSKIYNLGMRTNDSTEIQFIHTYNGISDTVKNKYKEICFNGSIDYTQNIEGQVGDHNLEVMIDSDSLHNDFNYSNNYLNLSFSVFPQGIQPLDPQNFWNISADNPIIRFVDPTLTEKSFEFKVFDNSNNIIFSTTSPMINNNYIEINPDNLIEGNSYRLEYKTIEKATGVESSIQYLDFYCSDEIDSLVKYRTEYWNKDLILENLILDDKSVVFDDVEYRVEMSSARGNIGGTIDRHAVINTINTKTEEVFTYINRLQRGFNIVVIPSLLSDTTYEVLHLDTWDSKFNNEDIYFDSRWLDRYLRDSLNYGDYLFIATADVPTRAPDKIDEDISPDSVGSTTRIVEALTNLGAKFADGLNFDASYVMFTRVGYPKSTIDRINTIDTIQLETNFKRFRSKGKINIPSIGNVKDLKSIEIESNSINISTIFNLIRNQNDTLFSENIDFIDFDNEFVGINSELFAVIDIERDSIGADLNINSFNIDFIPVPELAINNIDSKLIENNVERAVNAEYNYMISNISPRSNATTVPVNFEISNNFNSDYSYDTLEIINKDSNLSNNWSIDTKNLALNNSLSIEIDSSKVINESFYFNNKITNSLSIREDSTKPYLIAYYNNQILKDNDIVDIQPEITLELFDESTLNVIKNDVIFAKINRKAVLDNTTDKFNFEILNENKLKARLTFVMSDSLDVGQNILEVIGEDATGNKADTLTLSIYVPDEYQLKNSINYPNPFNESTTIAYEYYGKDKSNDVTITIYDAIGNEVTNSTSTATFGKNEYLWNGLNDDGSTSSSGIYFYQIRLKDNPGNIINGKMMKIN